MAISKITLQQDMGAQDMPIVITTYQPWFGENNKHHENSLTKVRPTFVPYNCTDPAYISGTFDKWQASGVKAFMANWYGDYAGFVDKATYMAFEEAKRRGMCGCLQFDKGVFKYKKHPTFSNLQEMKYQLDFIKNKYLNHPAHLKMPDGRFPMFEFCEGQLDGHWPEVMAYNKSIVWAAENIPANNAPKGTLPMRYNWTPTDPIKGSAWFGSNAQADKNHMYVGMLCKGFDDSNPSDPTKSMWNPTSPRRFYPENNGDTWLQVLANAVKYIAAYKYLLIVTHNDWEEGTAIEKGIENGVSIGVSFDAGKITLSAQGNLDAVHHYEILLQKPDNSSIVLNMDKSTTLDLTSRTELTQPGKYTATASAIGRACFLDKQSSPDTATATVKTQLVWA